MPVRVHKIGKHYVVKDKRAGKAPKGRVHKTRKKALSQMRMINMSLLGIKWKPKRKR